ncbi:adenosylcobinamide-GDP ribazoletransferase [Asanoa sp. WMMD1127]|uniref:adenosylcobinamide-GDP ribazoletransferase n=1 Tax=Asanoa sp. WMMD1127 TaxID=3016107 RepID=UPI002415D491|nr:adenosylcobinamide-GDP ribazoletransferase [Asanoa sp. WMMD1127]MDG4827202.1 adenosylcobinamide-GDP ribazoletransferase [Asanoa sp. WMMD1127]
MPDGLRLALTTFTVLPVRAGRVDRPAAAAAMALAPLVGAGLGAAIGGTVALLHAAGAPGLVAGAAGVGLAALLTRGLHLDGLADTVDGLGSYRSGPAALEIMKRPDIGPFGVVALTVTLLLQAAALGALTGLAAVLGGAAAFATGRLAVTWACRRGVPAARPEGLGALVAGTVAAPTLLSGTVATATLAVFAVPGRPLQGLLALAAGLAAGILLVRHAVRRFGGITGDVLGAAVEIATSVALLVLVLR